MPDEPQIGHLDIKHRSRIFWLLFVIFLCLLPVLIFYTTGYRLSFENEETSIVTTGGMYITTDILDVEVYLDGEQVERPRLFRSAYYIQNISTGQHRVVVQALDRHTWVKELPVDSRMVIEAAAFNMPVVPVVRPIAAYETATGTSIFVTAATSTELFPKATTTEAYLSVTSTTTLNLVSNEEFLFVDSLFSSTSSSSRSVFERFMDGVGQFGFATSTPEATATTVEDYPKRNDVELRAIGDEIFALWQGGSIDTIPHYFCVTDDSASSTAKRYGAHVAAAIAEYRVSTTTPLLIDTNRVCRPAIQLDRKRQNVYFYDFFPGNADLVLMQLEDGLYVSEIDDRAWQNTQLVYPGDSFQVAVENGVIYIQDGDIYVELVTELES